MLTITSILTHAFRSKLRPHDVRHMIKEIVPKIANIRNLKKDLEIIVTINVSRNYLSIRDISIDSIRT